jgi:hypothetical protein
MTTVAFGLELLVHQVRYLDIGSFPSLTLVVDNNPPQTLIAYSREAHTGDIWNLGEIFRAMYIVDAFETCVSWPVAFELVSPVESTALGKCSFEVKPLICDAIAAHGSSPVACQSAVLRDFERHEVAIVKFELRVIFFRMCQKRAATENAHLKELNQAVITRFPGPELSPRRDERITKADSQPTLNPAPQGLPPGKRKPPRAQSARFVQKST